MVELCLHSPICIHDIVLNYSIKYKDNSSFRLTSTTRRSSLNVGVLDGRSEYPDGILCTAYTEFHISQSVLKFAAGSSEIG
jgi:hypothetical protein